MNELVNATFTISSVEDTGTQIKIKDENGHTWSFFKNKRDGGMTVAFEQFQHYKVGELVGVSYKMAGEKGNIRSIMSFRPPMYDQVKPVTTAPVVKERNFDKEAYEKCCSIWAAADLGQGKSWIELNDNLEKGFYWQLFQAIRKDGEKRFATGWDKAKAIFNGSDVDIDAGNRAIQDELAKERYD